MNRRLRAFCNAYGLAREQRTALPEIIEIRLETSCAFIEKCAAPGDSGVERVIEEGHLALYKHDIDLLRRRRDELRKSLEQSPGVKSTKDHGYLQSLVPASGGHRRPCGSRGSQKPENPSSHPPSKVVEPRSHYESHLWITRKTLLIELKPRLSKAPRGA